MNHTNSSKTTEMHFKDVQKLQSYTEELEKDLSKSHNEISKLSNQLECLILLVKKAWTGDPLSNMHLARIIGAAPPSFEFAEDDSAVMTTVTPKSRALQNWVLLSVGLLNQEYKRMEFELQEQQSMYLHSRIVFLDDQINYANNRHHSCTDGKRNTTSSQSKILQNKGGLHSTQPPNSCRETNGDTEAPKSQRPLYRNEDQRKFQPHTAPLHWTDIYAQAQMTTNKTKLFELDVNYEDVKPTKKRPVSAIHSKPTIVTKTRPASAVVRGIRPMKYETTRPLSGKSSGNIKPAAGRPVSAVHTADAKKNTNKNDRPSSAYERKVFQHQKKILQKQIYDGLEDGEFPLEVRMTAAESVTKFEEELDQMSQMERQFKRTTLELQKKLGIEQDGMI